ncbi:MAG: hypothetical protein NTX45_19515 [Proteobacteria bacterium]|nr:hypothetical protein [Pseudomonadota bacterium]
MLRFLSSLFTGTAERSGGVDEALLEKAIDRVVVGTDPRIRALGDYQKRLREPVGQAVSHVIDLVDALPPPVAISPRAFSEDSGIRAFFVSTEHLRKVLGGFSTVRDYLTDLAELPPDDVFGLLTMAREERNVFGMELDGDNLRRDVMQVSVNFRNHRYLGPTGNELDTRRELKIRAFDFLIEKTLERITGERGKRLELDQQKHLLQQKLDAMKAGQWGLGMMLIDNEGQRPSLAKLEEKINLIDAELGQFHSDKLGLEESLAYVVDTLGQPSAWLAAREIHLRLDYRGIKLAESSAAPAREITLTELFSSTGECRTILLGRIARADIPEPPDIWNAAKSYL